jgi:hypothetical protein
MMKRYKISTTGPLMSEIWIGPTEDLHMERGSDYSSPLRWSLILLMLSLMGLFFGCDDDSSRADVVQVMTPTGGSQTGMMNGNEGRISGQLTLLQPINGAIFSQGMVVVRGTHPTAGRVQVNGQDLDLTNQQFETTLTLQEGAHSVEVIHDEERVVVEVLVDLTPPTAQITAPMYGVHVDSSRATTIEVVGQATDAVSGIQRVTVNGIEARVESNGRFQMAFTPEEGLGQAVVIIEDLAGHSTTATRGFLYGRYKDWNTPLNRAASAVVTPFALDALERAVVSAAGSGIIDQLIQERLGSEGSITINEIRYERLDVSIEPRVGYLEIEVVFHDLRIYFSLSTPEANGDVYITPARLNANLYLNPLPDGGLDIDVREAVVDLDDTFDIYVDNAAIGGAASFLEDYISGLAQDTLLELLESFFVQELINPELLRPTLAFLNRETDLQLLVEEVIIDPSGLSLAMGLDILNERIFNDAPGYLYIPSTSVPPPLPAMVSALIPLNTFYQVLGQLWRGGFMNISLDQIVETPPAPLQAQLLSIFTQGELLEYMSGGEYSGVLLRPQLPPTARFDATRADSIIIDIFDLMLDLTLPDGRAWLTLGLDIEFNIRPSIIRNEIKLDVSLKVRAWDVATPIFPVQSARIINVIVPLLEGLPMLLGPEEVNNLFNLSELDLFGVTLESAQLNTTLPPNPYLQLGLQVSVREPIP